MMNLSGPYIRFSKIVKYLHSREDAADAIKSLRNVGFARTSTKSEEEALSCYFVSSSTRVERSSFDIENTYVTSTDQTKDDCCVERSNENASYLVWNEITTGIGFEENDCQKL